MAGPEWNERRMQVERFVLVAGTKRTTPEGFSELEKPSGVVGSCLRRPGAAVTPRHKFGGVTPKTVTALSVRSGACPSGTS